MIVMLSLIKEQSGSMMSLYHAPALFLYQQQDVLTVALWIIIISGIAFLLFRGGIMSRTVPQQSTEALMQKLFKWKRQVEYNGVIFYIRVVSDMVIEDARRHALVEARKLRRELRDPNSNAYLIYIDVLEEYDLEQLIGLIEISASRQVMQEYIQNNPRPTVQPLRDGASQQEMEEHEAELEQRNEDYIANMQQVVKDWREQFDTDLRKQSEDVIRSTARRHEIDRVCEDLFRKEFETYVIAASVYKDSQYKERMFTLEEYKSLPTEVKNLLYETYNNINVGADDIKNS